MFEKLWKFLTNAQAFDAAVGGLQLGALFERVKPTLKMVLLSLGGMLMTGQITLGPAGYWVAPFVLSISGLLQKNPDLLAAVQRMTDSQKQQLAAHLGPLVGPAAQP
jgi:hypothetical protein